MASSEPLELLKPILDDISNGVTVADATVESLPLTFVNKAFEKITGYASSEVLGQNCRFLQGEATDPHELGRLREALRLGEGCHVLLRNYRKDGTVFLNELKIQPVVDGAGHLTHFIGIQNDVTAVLVARTLQRQLSSDSQLTAAWPDARLGLGLPEVQEGLRRPPEIFGVAVSDHRGQIRYANPAFARMVRKRRQSLLSTSVFDHIECPWLSGALISNDQSEHEWQHARLVQRGRAIVELSHYRVLPDFSSMPLHVMLIRASELTKPAATAST